MTLTLEQLKARCPAVDEALIERHLARLAERYFDCFSLDDVARHIEAIARLTPEAPVVAIVEGGAEGRVECTFLAFDYPGEFSMFAGVLSSLGFNVLSGDIFTYEREPAPARAPSESSRRAARRFLSRRAAFVAAKPKAADLLQRRCVIDRFQGVAHSLVEDSDPAAVEAWAMALRERVGEIIGLLERGETETARNRVNEMVTRRLEESEPATVGVLYPIDLQIDNDAGPFTRLKVVSQDTPAFLYSLSNALSLRGVSIERVVIRTFGERIEDEIDFVDLRGAKVEDAERLNQIRLSVLLTKQFTYFLPGAPDPHAALVRFNSLLEDVLQLPERGRWVEFFSQRRNLEHLARLLGASTFMWEDFIRLQHDALLPMLEPQAERRRLFDRDGAPRRLEAALEGARTYEELRDRLNAFKDHEIYLIDLDHIVRGEAGDPRALAEDLTRLAECVLRQAFEIVHAQLTRRHGVPRTVGGLEARCAVMGLGKLGGVALGYASDIELLFVYSDLGETDGPERIRNSEFFERLVQEFRDFIRAKRDGIFNLDLRLRPHGADGPLACSLESFCRYFGAGGEAHSYERLALARLRAIGGDAALGAQIERLRDAFLYATQNIDPQAIRDLRRKQYEELTDGRPNAKFSPGALVDLEYDVQILQVLHANRIPALKTPRIHEALAALTGGGILAPHEGERLRGAYYFLRRLINGLRMLRGNARDLFLPPVNTDEFRHLARRMGYEKKGELDRSRQLYLDFETHTAAVRAFVERHFGREWLPGAAPGNVADLVLSDHAPRELAERILSAAGFKDTQRARVNLRQLAGEGATREQFARLAVLACDMLRGKPHPDMALNNWERFVASLADPKAHFELLLGQPRRLDILLSIFAGSQFLADTLVNNPEFFEWATSPDNLNRALKRADALAELRALSAQCASHDAWLNAIRKHRRREFLRIGTRDICLGVAILEITGELSVLAECLAQVVLERVWAERADLAGKSDGADSGQLAARFCILAFGKLGGGELNYSSDIDLIGVFDGAPSPAFAKALERVRHDLSAHTVEGHAYRVDLRLRAYGSSGELVHSLDALEAYYREKAALWEIQALLKLRPIAGALDVGAALRRRLRFVFEQRRSLREVATAIESLRGKAIRKSRRRALAPAGPGGTRDERIDIKEGAGGIRDVEFLVQGIQLLRAPEHPELLEGNTLRALDVARRLDIIPSETAAQLGKDYIFLRRIEHFLQILEDRQTHSLPTDLGELSALARRVLGPGNDGESFIAQARACLTRVRQAYEDCLLKRPRDKTEAPAGATP